MKQALKIEEELTYIDAMDIIGGLSKPSKMPWHGWSTSAYDCKTGSKLRGIKGSTCSSCYACKGNYCFQNVKDAHARRMAGLSHPQFVEAFILVLNTLYERGKKTYVYRTRITKENRFRWHDSGDIQSVEHLRMINEIAKATPKIRHWIPTREYGMVNEFLKTNKFAFNLTVRMSAVMIGDEFKKQPMGLPSSTVGVKTAKSQCPAYTQGGACQDCNRCWDKTVKNVNYPLH